MQGFLLRVSWEVYVFFQATSPEKNQLGKQEKYYNSPVRTEA